MLNVIIYCTISTQGDNRKQIGKNPLPITKQIGKDPTAIRKQIGKDPITIRKQIGKDPVPVGKQIVKDLIAKRKQGGAYSYQKVEKGRILQQLEEVDREGSYSKRKVDREGSYSHQKVEREGSCSSSKMYIGRNLQLLFKQNLKLVSFNNSIQYTYSIQR